MTIIAVSMLNKAKFLQGYIVNFRFNFLSKEPHSSYNILDISYSDAIHLKPMIKSFRHGGIERFFRKGSKAGIQPKHAEKLRRQLFALDNAKLPQDMNAPGWRLHQLRGELSGHWSVDVSGNWRLTFAFDGNDAILVDYQDYH